MAKTLAQGRKPGSGRKPGKAKTLAEGRKVGSGRKPGSKLKVKKPSAEAPVKIKTTAIDSNSNHLLDQILEAASFTMDSKLSTGNAKPLALKSILNQEEASFEEQWRR